MFPKYLNGQLVTAVIAVSLSASFFYEPSFPRRILDGGHETQEFKKIMRKEVWLNEREMQKMYLHIIDRNKYQDTVYWGAQGAGVFFGWQLAEVHGGRSVLHNAIVVRLVGLLFHCGEAAYRTYYPLSATLPATSSLPPVSQSRKEDPVKCGSVQVEFKLLDRWVTKEPRNSTTSRSTATAITSNAGTVTETLSPESPPAMNNSCQISPLDISLLSKLVHGMYSGISSFVGISYLYDISPKEPKAQSVVLALYYWLTTILKFVVEMGTLPSVTFTSEDDARSWFFSGILTFVAMWCQEALLKRCPDTPDFLMHTKKNKEEAKKVLMRLRQTLEVDKELELLENKTPQRDFMVRCGIFIIMYMIYMVFNSTYTFLGMLSGATIGIHPEFYMSFFYTVNITSFFFALTCYKDCRLITIRNVLLYYWKLLAIIFFINASLSAANFQFSPAILQENPEFSTGVVVVALFMQFLFCSGLAFFTVAMTTQYSACQDDMRSIVVNGFCAVFFSLGGSDIFCLTGIHMDYYRHPVPWILLGVIVWMVGNNEMASFPANSVPFSAFDLLRWYPSSPVSKDVKIEVMADIMEAEEEAVLYEGDDMMEEKTSA